MWGGVLGPRGLRWVRKSLLSMGKRANMENVVCASATGAHSASQPVQGLAFVSITRGKAEERVWGWSLGSGGLPQVRKSQLSSETGAKMENVVRERHRGK